MNIPLIYFLYLFLAVMIIWLAMSLLGLFHLLTHSANDKKAPVIASIYVAVSAGILIYCFMLTASIDWTQEFNLSLPALGQQNIIE